MQLAQVVHSAGAPLISMPLLRIALLLANRKAADVQEVDKGLSLEVSPCQLLLEKPKQCIFAGKCELWPQSLLQQANHVDPWPMLRHPEVG
jgi:hypothetical protein